ncbi:carboxylesterase/lipase family protein [Microbacterium sp. 1.5R]|uniref:carboxylesterase/lipase family protein n=1 Tax=Microbacterium sp. 1.5R TaxID=1916917 RepID=UPI0011A16D19|nr:carboxylesterase family protein [Microbacterium sp. 1.5R]
MTAAPILHSHQGDLRGVRVGDVIQFRGVPYAAPAEGDLRFRGPQPLTPWSGERDATDWGAMSPQPTGSSMSLKTVRPQLYDATFGESYGQRQGEDCLTLHVWAPAETPAPARPVMVWVHGGAFDHGTSATLRTDGSALASTHGVVMVSITHRLGALGFAAFGDLDDAGVTTPNAGLLDIVAGLHWVQENIAAVGGDPDNVTLFGESGGGTKIASLLGMPLSEGLFHRAILQSTPLDGLSTREETTDAAALLAAELGIARSDSLVADLQRVPVAAIVQAQHELVESGRLRSMSFAPTVDGVVLTETPYEALTRGRGARMPILMGIDEREIASFSSADTSLDGLDDAGLSTRAREYLGVDGDALIAAYRSADPDLTPRDVWVRIISDRALTLALVDVGRARTDAATADTFQYLFTWVSPAWPEIGSFHGSEAAFVFDTVAHVPLAVADPEAQSIADVVSAAWVSFARTGEPGWPEHRSDAAVYALPPVATLLSDPFGPIRDAWRRTLDGSS